MDMENKQIRNYLSEAADRVLARKEANKGHEYEGYWFSVNYAAIRGGYMAEIGARQFSVFLAIRSFMNVKTKIAYPQLNTLKKYTGLCINTIRKDTDTLQEKGWIKKIIERDAKGKFSVTKYLILQTDIVRGAGEPSFRKEPISRRDNGYQAEPLLKDGYRNLTNKKYKYEE